MPRYTWNTTLDVGVDAMNDEHRILLDHMETLHEAVRSGAPFDAQLAALDVVIAYAAEHFADEEAYMASIGWPKLAEHRIIHQMLVRKIGKHRDTILAAGAITDRLFDFLEFWLVTHIQGIDAAYGAHEAEVRASA